MNFTPFKRSRSSKISAQPGCVIYCVHRKNDNIFYGMNKFKKKFREEWVQLSLDHMHVEVHLDHDNAVNLSNSLQGAITARLIVKIDDGKSNFKLTDLSLSKLRQERVSKSILKNLEIAKDQEINSEEMFLEFVKQAIGSDEIPINEKLILKHANNTNKLEDSLKKVVETFMCTTTSDEHNVLGESFFVPKIRNMLLEAVYEVVKEANYLKLIEDPNHKDKLQEALHHNMQSRLEKIRLCSRELHNFSICPFKS